MGPVFLFAVKLNALTIYCYLLIAIAFVRFVKSRVMFSVDYSKLLNQPSIDTSLVFACTVGNDGNALNRYPITYFLYISNAT